MSVNYSSGSLYTYPISPQSPSYALISSPERRDYEKAGNEFRHGGHDFFADQYGRNINRGLEALTAALQQDLSQMKSQLLLNQAHLAQIQNRLNMTA